MNFDILHRWLAYSGYRVLFCRNVTDIEDKIISRSLSEGVHWWRITDPVYRSFESTYEALGCLPPSVEPRATGHIPEMLELIEQLLASGNAYVSDGDVYFSISSFPAYGELSGQRPSQMRGGEEPGHGKRDPRDFALWKRGRPGEPVWHARWGDGRPGWHLECSAMARKYLGAEFDIHGGGANLIFPHHENEIAQSRAAGDGFARFWIHNGPVTHRGEKIRKVAKNPLAVHTLLRRIRPVELRYYLAAAHYRSPMEFSVGAVEESAVAYRRIERFVHRVAVGAPGALPPQFREAMDHDLNLPQAVSLIHAAVNEGNAALDSGDVLRAARKCSDVRAMLDVLGLDPMSDHWARETHLREVAGAVLHVVRNLAEASAERGEFEHARIMHRQIDTALKIRQRVTL